MGPGGGWNPVTLHRAAAAPLVAGLPRLPTTRSARAYPAPRHLTRPRQGEVLPSGRPLRCRLRSRNPAPPVPGADGPAGPGGLVRLQGAQHRPRVGRARAPVRAPAAPPRRGGGGPALLRTGRLGSDR
jgi:hypothetical protein